MYANKKEKIKFMLLTEILLRIELGSVMGKYLTVMHTQFRDKC